MSVGKARTELMALAQAMAGGNALWLGSSRDAAVAARDACGLGPGFRHKVGKGMIQFDWVGSSAWKWARRKGLPPVEPTVVIDEYTDIP